MKIVDRLLGSDQWIGRAGHEVELIVLHITDGNDVDGAINHWKKPEVEASAHYIIDKDGTIYRVVDEANTAWCNGLVNQPDLTNPIIARLAHQGVNPNRVTIGVEIVGRPGPTKPSAQWAAVRELVTDLCRRYQLPQDRTHVIGHYQLDRVNRLRCPSLTAQQWAEATTPLTPWSVGAGVRAAMAAQGDSPAGHEVYLHERISGADIGSVTPGRKGEYRWNAQANRVSFTPWAD